MNRISLEELRVYIQFHDPYHSFNSNGSLNNGLRAVQFVNRISLGKVKEYIHFNDLYDLFDFYGSLNNGLRIVQLVNCISLERPRVYTSPRSVRFVQFERVVKQWFTCRTVCELHIIRDLFRVCIQVHDPYDSFNSNGS